MKNLRKSCKCLYNSLSSLRDLFSCYGGQLEISEGYICFFRYFLCVRIEIVSYLTSDLLPNISLVVGQSSVNVSLALCARDISTLRLTSNQWYIGQQITVTKILFLKLNMFRITVASMLDVDDSALRYVNDSASQDVTDVRSQLKTF